MKGAGSKLKNLLINPLKIKKYFNNEIMAGFKKYCDIFQRHKDSYIFLTGSGKGDLYILGLYYKEYLESNNLAQKSVLAVTGKSGQDVADLFKISSTEVISKEDNLALIHFFVFSKDAGANIDILHHHIFARHTGILMWMEGLNGLDFKSCTSETIFDQFSNIQYPEFYKNEEFLRTIFANYKLQEQNTVLLCPYANSVKKLPNVFWEKLTDTLLEKGYCVCTNSVGEQEPPIRGTPAVFIPYKYSVPFLERAGYLVSLRSGFNDVTSSAHCKMAVLYPENDFRRGLAATLSSRASFSMQTMYERRDVIEMDVDTKNIYQVINNIVCMFRSSN